MGKLPMPDGFWKKKKASKQFDYYTGQDIHGQAEIDNENLKKKRDARIAAIPERNIHEDEEISSEKSEPGSYDNPLHKFATYNTIFTLSGISEDELANREYLDNTPHDIIARSGGIGNANVSSSGSSKNTLKAMMADARRGKKNVNINTTQYDQSILFLSQGRDIFFENVNILSTAGPNAERGLSNFQKMEFELHEPFNITLVERIRAATFLNGYFDYQDAPLLLTIQWKGFDEHGKQMIDSRLERKIPIRIVRVEFDADQGGAKYQCVAVAAESLAFDDRFKFPRRALKIPTSKYKEWQEEIEAQLSEMMQNEIDEGVREKKDIYKFHIDPLVFKHAEDMGLSGNIFANKKRSKNRVGKKPENLTPKLEGIDVQVDSQHALTQVFEDSIRSGLGYAKLVEGFWYEWGKVLMNRAKLAVPTSHDKKRNQKAVHDFLLGDKFTASLSEEKNQWIDWFMIKPKVETIQNDFDSITKMERKIITYAAIPIKIHVLKFVKPGVSFGNIDWSPMIRKKYDYIYTGENVDIQRLRIFYKTAYYMRNIRLKDADASGKETGVVQFEEEFEQQLNQVFGREGPFSGETAQTRQYPSTTRSKPLVQTGDIRYKKSQEFYDYITNPQADMLRIELEILGDPAYICQDQFTNLGKDNSKAFSDKPWNNRYGSFNAEAYQPVILLNYILPTDVDDKKGIFFAEPSRSLFFNGIYQVVKIESSIAEGSFTQTLHCVRLNNQQGSGKEVKYAGTYKKFGIEEDKKEKSNIKRKKIDKRTIIEKIASQGF